MSNLTEPQRQAVQADGNVLVIAGAGAGKTLTLVERCVARVLADEAPVSVDEVLMVTFTEAAASEMRRRIRERLEAEVAGRPTNTRLGEQIALLDAAGICTLHSFCFRLVREHFHDLDLDPQVAVLDPPQQRVLAAEVMDELLDRKYAGLTKNDEAVRQLALDQGGGSDQPVRHLVLRLHAYTQTLPDPEGWFRDRLAEAEQAEPQQWKQWLRSGEQAWRREWLERLATLAPENPNAGLCFSALEHLTDSPAPTDLAAALDAVTATDGQWPTRRKTALRAPLKVLFEEAAFLRSLVAEPGQVDPLQQDWDWVRPNLITLLGLAREFTERFSQTKRELGVVDFADVEQGALRLLWERPTGRPSLLAEQWRRRLVLVFVDEYQDINPAQDRIIQALGRDAATPNRFLVGDIKQSIYRFRLADPRIFQMRAKAWQTDPGQGQVIPLTDNFRSQEVVLDFVNMIFTGLMRLELGGVTYDESARLRCGDPARRRSPPPTPSASDAEPPPVELLLRLNNKSQKDDPDLEGVEPTSGNWESQADLTNTEIEASLLGRRLRELKQQPYPIWDRTQQGYRSVTWQDMVVLLRSPRHQAETFAKVFEQLGIPLDATRRGLFATTEVSDLLRVLELLDNPLQDIPALAVLRSPLVGLSLNELAVIRLHQRQGNFWTALLSFHRTGDRPSSISGAPGSGQASKPVPVTEPELAPIRSSAWRKIDSFLNQYQRWRTLVRRGALSHALETVLDETRFEDGLRAQPRGEQRCANVQRLLAITRHFDRLQRPGLLRFLRFVEAQQEVDFDPEPATVGSGDAVRLMSIHQSKGLEFPIVAVAGLGRLFNLQDLKASLILDETYGLCPLVKPPQSRQAYPSLPYWLAVRCQRREALGEELRLLYVATTRACDKLILCGTTSQSSAQEKWPMPSGATLTARQLTDARTYLDWIGPVVTQFLGDPAWLSQASGRCRFLAWTVQSDASMAVASPVPPLEAALPKLGADEAAFARLSQRVQWQYAHQAATRETAKASVSALRRRTSEAEEVEAQAWFQFRRERHSRDAGLSAAEIGAAHHRFLQWVALDRTATRRDLEAEARRLVGEGHLSQKEAVELDLRALARFWESNLGQRIRAQRHYVERELQFTARLARDDFRALSLPQADGLGADEFVVVQGVADLVVLEPQALWLVDFKTDRVGAGEVEQRAQAYRPQLALYGLALARIYKRPVREAWLYFLAVDKAFPSLLVGAGAASVSFDPPAAP